ncbi:MAG: hypothetical protein RIN55_11405 [Tissierellaceae bacterium]|nr:hypothetical protein [Tissierellaceae bacterium]
MDILTINDLDNLINKEEGTFISIYLPTFRSGVDIRQNPIRFKQLLREAEATLYDMGWRKEDIETFLKPATELVTDTKFWQNQSDGLAYFIHEDGITYFRVPFEFKESVTVSNKVYIKPLLPLFSGNGQFNILALSKNAVRFFRCTRQNAVEIELEDLPRSMFDMQVDDDYEDIDTRTSLRLGSNQLVYNKATQAQTNENEYEKNELTRYFRAIDEALLNFHEGENIPLVLAGVEYLIPIYREKSNYPNIVKDFIRGNPEMLSTDDLHKLAWEVVEPIFLEAQELAKSKYTQFSGQRNNLVLNSLDKIIPAAFNGQIESLFIDKDTNKWGKFDHEKNRLEIKEEGSTEAEDLIEYVSILTLSRGGKVFALDIDEIPNEETVAAVLRY